MYSHSIGEALIDTIDDLINDGRIEPQLAMKILSNFDRAIAETLAEKVKSRVTFKVSLHKRGSVSPSREGYTKTSYRATWKRIDSATTSGLSWSKMSDSKVMADKNSKQTRSRL